MGTKKQFRIKENQQQNQADDLLNLIGKPKKTIDNYAQILYRLPQKTTTLTYYFNTIIEEMFEAPINTKKIETYVKNIKNKSTLPYAKQFIPLLFCDYFKPQQYTQEAEQTISQTTIDADGALRIAILRLYLIGNPNYTKFKILEYAREKNLFIYYTIKILHHNITNDNDIKKLVKILVDFAVYTLYYQNQEIWKNVWAHICTFFEDKINIIIEYLITYAQQNNTLDKIIDATNLSLTADAFFNLSQHTQETILPYVDLIKLHHLIEENPSYIQQYKQIILNHPQIFINTPTLINLILSTYSKDIAFLKKFISNIKDVDLLEQTYIELLNIWMGPNIQQQLLLQSVPENSPAINKIKTIAPKIQKQLQEINVKPETILAIYTKHIPLSPENHAVKTFIATLLNQDPTQIQWDKILPNHHK